VFSDVECVCVCVCVCVLNVIKASQSTEACVNSRWSCQVNLFYLTPFISVYLHVAIFICILSLSLSPSLSLSAVW